MSFLKLDSFISHWGRYFRTFPVNLAPERGGVSGYLELKLKERQPRRALKSSSQTTEGLGTIWKIKLERERNQNRRKGIKLLLQFSF